MVAAAAEELDAAARSLTVRCLQLAEGLRSLGWTVAASTPPLTNGGGGGAGSSGSGGGSGGGFGGGSDVAVSPQRGERSRARGSRLRVAGGKQARGQLDRSRVVLICLTRAYVEALVGGGLTDKVVQVFA